MRIVLCENYEELSEKAAKLVQSQLLLKPSSVLGLATGSTPMGMYRELCRMHREEELDFSHAVSYNLDEYYPISPENENSYAYYMKQNLFSHVNFVPGNCHIPCGSAPDPEAECRAYTDVLNECGGIDLQILGIGENGHIGFNEPNLDLQTETHLTDLTESTIHANSRFFDCIDEVPKRAITMGVSSILKSKKILLLISGKAKHKVTMELFHDKITTSVPATILKLHSDVVLICDKEAYYG